MLRQQGYSVVATDSPEEALERIRKGFFDIVLTDLVMQPVDGLTVLRETKRVSPATQVIVMTAYGSIRGGVEAIRAGAFDYLTKPFINDELVLTIERALEHLRLTQELRHLRIAMQERYQFDSIIGQSPEIRRVLQLVMQVAETDSTVLITGESGTGKELVAKAIHANSRRRDFPFVVVNCGTGPENLQESEFFGHVRGAFTGAVANKVGLFQEADRGTLFLDEVGEMAPSTQVKLLRFLQDGEIRRVGDNRSIQLDVRLIAATNRDLEEDIRAGTFRQDLFYRLNVIPIHLPPLRQRKSDIPLLVDHFVKKHAEKIQKPVQGFTPKALNLLMQYQWPGNVRELENAVERAVVLAQDPIMTPEVLPAQVVAGQPAVPIGTPGTLREMEKSLIIETLNRCGGSRKRAAEELGISKTTLWRKLKEFGLFP
jgi:DNA-binding NtrC family response regulator